MTLCIPQRRRIGTHFQDGNGGGPVHELQPSIELHRCQGLEYPPPDSRGVLIRATVTDAVTVTVTVTPAKQHIEAWERPCRRRGPPPPGDECRAVRDRARGWVVAVGGWVEINAAAALGAHLPAHRAWQRRR